MNLLKKIIKNIINYLAICPLQVVMTVLLLPIVVIGLIIKKGIKLTDRVDSEITSYIHKTFKD